MQHIKLGSYKTTHGSTTCLYWEGNKFIHVLTLSSIPLTVTRKLKSELRFIQPLTRKGEPYPMKRALKIYRCACKWGGSKSARALIRQAAKEASVGRAKTPKG